MTPSLRRPIFSQALRLGVLVEGSEQLLSVRLGPGILGNIFDGLLRPITDPQEPYATPGMRDLPAASFSFRPGLEIGANLTRGGILGEVENDRGATQRCLAPPDIPGGEVLEIADPGDYREDEVVCRLRDSAGKVDDLTMDHRWPVRVPRPVAKRLPASEPMLTGQRIIDSLFPVAKGGAAAIPGGFGTGKTYCWRLSPSGAMRT